MIDLTDAIAYNVFRRDADTIHCRQGGGLAIGGAHRTICILLCRYGALYGSPRVVAAHCAWPAPAGRVGAILVIAHLVGQAQGLPLQKNGA